eukprot:9350577-Pyramimonas_sp.AAC.2
MHARELAPVILMSIKSQMHKRCVNCEGNVSWLTHLQRRVSGYGHKCNQGLLGSAWRGCIRGTLKFTESWLSQRGGRNQEDLHKELTRDSTPLTNVDAKNEGVYNITCVRLFSDANLL